MPEGKLLVYDPRKGHDWRMQLACGKTFSSLARRLLVIDSEPKHVLLGGVKFARTVDLDELKGLISTCIQRFGKLGFVVADPTPAGLHRIPAVELHTVATSGCGYFAPRPATLDAILAARSSPTYGLWILGSCNEKIGLAAAPVPGKCYDSSLVLEQFERVACAFFQEGNWITVMIPLFEGIDAVLAECPALEAASRSSPPESMS